MLGRIIVGLLLAFAGGTSAEPIFTRLGDQSVPTHEYTGGWEFFVGGGVASFDCDDDFFPELFIAGGASNSVLFRNKVGSRGGGVLLVAETPGSLAIPGVTGAYPLDVDNDGILDLFVMRVGENQLLQGGPDCSFSPFSQIAFDGGDGWTTAFSATWEQGNDLPSLAIGNYVDRGDPDGPFEACDANQLMRPTGGRYSSTPLEPGYCPLSMLFSDWGRNGRQDLRVSNDRHYYVREGNEQMWAMEDTPQLYTKSDGWKNYQIWGMGIASRDITGDGYPEVFLTSMGDQKLQMLEIGQNGPAYGEATYGRGTTAHRPYTGDDGRPSTGWHAQFGDVNNDGLDDVFIAKGNVDQMPNSAMADPNNLLIQSADGSFNEAGLTAGIATAGRSRGAALVDLNLDGLLDLVVVNRRSAVEIYENSTAASGDWLLLEIGQDGTNQRAVGAWVEIKGKSKTWHREITVGGGHASGTAALMHFGLGTNEKVKIRVTWPDGETTNWFDIGANRIWRITRTKVGLTVTPKEI